MAEVDLLDRYPRTTRDIAGRAAAVPAQREVASRFAREYFDGDRGQGYGGYRYDGRWKVVAEQLIDHYKLGPTARILDVGCGKAHLLHELKQLLPDSDVTGFDVSHHGLADAPPDIKPYLFRYRAQDPYPWGDQHFDLVISFGCLHNLRVFELKTACSEIERVGKQGYIMLESYRSGEAIEAVRCLLRRALAEGASSSSTSY